MDTLVSDCLNVFEYEARAKTSLAEMAYDYYSGGSWDEVTLRENCSDFSKLAIMPHMLIDLTELDMSTELFGDKISMPIVVAPTAFHQLATADGERATARAAHRAGTIMTLSTLANFSIEEVQAAAPGPKWFQLYVYKDREVTKDLVQRAEANGYKALVLTVDSPILGRREKDVRNRFCLPSNFRLGHFDSGPLSNLPANIADSGLAAYIGSLYDTSLSWKHVEWLSEITKLPILLKGILRADDAALGVKNGAAGIIVSNHGGRQLDSAPSTISVLSEVVEAVQGKVPVLLDSGIRRGTDVFKAIGLGARAVLTGRPILWGLATNGEQGAYDVLEMLRSELQLTMQLAGCPTLKHITPDMVRNKTPFWAK
ncbi:MAG TPA: alpha-hydroxy acid oxidase [Candidatus Melainabacteria bacterium]|nr:alpha-hydroxy acid oxidase [Candidatus Melainabacteria bacterium]